MSRAIAIFSTVASVGIFFPRNISLTYPRPSPEKSASRFTDRLRLFASIRTRSVKRSDNDAAGDIAESYKGYEFTLLSIESDSRIALYEIR